MFTELMPLLVGRTVLITVARESDKTIRATVVPKRISESENAALSTPLSFVGTPEELDRDFTKELAAYTDAHRQLGSTLAEAKATMEAAAKAAMEAAAKAAQEEANRKADEKRKAKSSAPMPAPAVSTPPAPAANADPAPESTSSLFGETPAGPTQTQQQGGLRL